MTFLIQAQAQDKEVQAIEARAVQFSKYLMAGDLENVVNMYTKDAKIFPADQAILEGDELVGYWNPGVESSWKTTKHKLIPLEIKVWDNEAYDYGYYEGTSSNGEQTSNWKGKYVVIWRKEAGEWKMYLDIWNRVKLDE